MKHVSMIAALLFLFAVQATTAESEEGRTTSLGNDNKTLHSYGERERQLIASIIDSNAALQVIVRNSQQIMHSSDSDVDVGLLNRAILYTMPIVILNAASIQMVALAEDTSDVNATITHLTSWLDKASAYCDHYAGAINKTMNIYPEASKESHFQMNKLVETLRQLEKDYFELKSVYASMPRT